MDDSKKKTWKLWRDWKESFHEADGTRIGRWTIQRRRRGNCGEIGKRVSTKRMGQGLADGRFKEEDVETVERLEREFPRSGWDKDWQMDDSKKKTWKLWRDWKESFHE